MFLSILKVLSELNLGFFSFKYIYVYLPTRWAPPKASVLEFQGEGAIRLVEKKLSIAFCALSSTSLSGLDQEIINTPTYTLFLHMMQ